MERRACAWVLLACLIAQPIFAFENDDLLLGAIIVVNAADVYQTDYLMSHGYEETNPLTRGIFGEDVSALELVALKAAILIPVIWYAYQQPPRWRNRILAVTAIVCTQPVVQNELISGGIMFKF